MNLGGTNTEGHEGGKGEKGKESARSLKSWERRGIQKN